MSAQAVGPDFATLLTRHDPEHIEGYWCSCSDYKLEKPWNEHVADHLRAEVGRWLGSEGAEDVAADALIVESRGVPAHRLAAAALAALAEQVAQVAPSRVPGEES